MIIRILPKTPIVLLCLALFGALVSGCSSTSFKTLEMNKYSGVTREVHYTRDFLAEDWLVPNSLKLSVVGTLKSKFGKDADPGRFDDVYLPEYDMPIDYKIIFSSDVENKLYFTLITVKYLNGDPQEYVFKGPRQIVLTPKAAQRVEIKDHFVDKFKTEIPLEITMFVADKKVVKTLTLRRQVKNGS